MSRAAEIAGRLPVALHSALRLWPEMPSPMPPEVAELNARGLMHITARKDRDGRLIGWRAHLTADGLEVRQILLSEAPNAQ